ncbi:MAG: deoxyribose-phosphate aldolase [Fluviicola sp.]|nr:MAG: deoxyribose-phosphate aldolase [Fluviicola sp.]
MRLLLLFILFIALLLVSCENTEKEVRKGEKSLNASEIIDRSYKFYNVERLQEKDISFRFRIHDYSFLREENGIARHRKTVDTNSIEIKDVWKNGEVQRFLDDSLVVITKKQEKAYRNSINSVFYFAFLPKGLTDPAVNTELVEEVNIKGRDYYKVRVTFDEEGGGEDHNDIFLYWFDKEDFSMDYVAYQYFTEAGGIRFREAINSRQIEGITFQDYVNYKPETKDLKLEHSDQAFENDELIEVSRIELENLEVY